MSRPVPASSGPVLLLDRSRTSRAFEPDESLWDRELKRMFELVRKHVQALEAMKDEDPDKLPMLSIALFGTYGSGKTSLLKTFARRANSGELEGKHKGLNGRLYALPDLQPNVMSEDDHFLYAFLASALEEDLKPRGGRRHPRYGRQRPPEAAAAWEREQDSASSHILSPVQQAFQGVSEYLQVIDDARRTHEYDPLGLSLERLERHTSGLRLQEKLAELISELAYRLAGPSPSSVILLPIDDADMAQDKLVSILDTYRRYLMHPRLVPVFTFTDRLAEELLRVHFARQLTLKESRRISRELSETSTALEMTEHLAFQYLVKLFPIRNRIRLGPAAARVQASKFTLGYQVGEENGETEVMGLLKAASTLLFGCSEWPIVPSVRVALRPSTLRRQLQVIDAMNDAGIGNYLGDDSERQLEEPWWSTFHSATWSLLNAHRDALREYNLHMENLYSWTPRGLRRFLLITILSLEQPKRARLIVGWRYRIEERRYQVISLLAASAFRPRMNGEEPAGDEPWEWDAYRTELRDLKKAEPSEPPRHHFSMMKGAVWLLDLWTGFYLPQILARNRATRPAADGASPKKISGVGWSLKSGPSHAIREFVASGEVSASGMMLLDVERFVEKLRADPDSVAVETHLLIHLWCFYGSNRGRTWVAVSLWRGLALIGQLLEDYVRLRAPRPGGVGDAARAEDEVAERVEAVLRKQYEAAREPGSRGANDPGFPRWDRQHGEALDKLFEILARDVEKWLYRYRRTRIHPRLPDRAGDEQNRWQTCFIRLLHGDQLLGEFWRQLGGASLEPPDEDEDDVWFSHAYRQSQPPEDGERDEEPPWTASTALSKWTAVFETYLQEVEVVFPGGSSTSLGHFFRECPLIGRWIPSDGDGGPGGDPEAEERRRQVQESLDVPSQQGEETGPKRAGENVTAENGAAENGAPETGTGAEPDGPAEST